MKDFQVPLVLSLFVMSAILVSLPQGSADDPDAPDR